MPRSPVPCASLLIVSLILAGCATGRDKLPIVDHQPETEILIAKVYDSWSTRQMKGSLYTTFELRPGWQFSRPPSAQSSAGTLVPGRSTPVFWEMSFQPIDSRYQLASGPVKVNMFWEAVGPGGAHKAGRTSMLVAIGESLAPSVLDFTSEEKVLAVGASGK